MRREMVLVAVVMVLLEGCKGIGNPRPKLYMSGDSGYVYTMVGLMWGSTNTMTTLNEEDFIDLGSSDSGGSKGRSGGCSGGHCGIK